MKKSVSLLIVVGIVLAANVLVQPFLVRLDFTQGKQYTLTKATKEILKKLREPVTVTAYFSDGLPPDVGKVRRDFQDLLVEYAAVAKGNLDFDFISPQSDAQKQEAAQYGIQPLMINVREKDQIKQQQAFLGAVIRKGNQTEVIPFVEPGASMEYSLSSAIKKLSIIQKPTVAFLQGHGEPSLNELSQVARELGMLYDLITIDFNTSPAIPDSVKVAVWFTPKSAVPPGHLAAMDAYLAQGGQMVVGINRMEVDMQTGTALNNETGMEAWLQSKGIEADSSLVIDVQCGNVTVPQNLGMMQINTQVKFPYLPLVNTFADHPVTKGLEQVLLPYVSPLRFVGNPNGAIQFTPLLFSSSRSGIQPAPVVLQVTNKKWIESDFPLRNLILGGLLSGPLGSGEATRMIVFGDGDFPLSGQQGKAMSDDNVHLLVNAVDWLGDESGLMNLRTKAITSRPIDASFLLDESNSKRQLIKWLNVGLPVLLVILAGFFFHQRNARIRRRRMGEQYN